jgi:hypothetical protein
MSTGAQWRAEVKAALAATHRQQRQRRGKRRRSEGEGLTGPGMVRIVPRPPRDDGQRGEAGEMPEPRVRGEMEDRR